MRDDQNLQPGKHSTQNASESDAIYSCLYVSQSNLAPPASHIELDKLLYMARSKNQELDVTGALLCTAGRFAQILEGPEASVRLLLDTIIADPRHRNVKIISEGVICARRFSQWSMAYMGSSIYIDRHIKPLLQNLMGQNQIDECAIRLVDLMVEHAPEANRVSRLSR